MRFTLRVSPGDRPLSMHGCTVLSLFGTTHTPAALTPAARTHGAHTATSRPRRPPAWCRPCMRCTRHVSFVFMTGFLIVEKSELPGIFIGGEPREIGAEVDAEEAHRGHPPVNEDQLPRQRLLEARKRGDDAPVLLRPRAQPLELHEHGVLGAAARAAGGGEVPLVLRARHAMPRQPEALVRTRRQAQREPAARVHHRRHTCVRSPEPNQSLNSGGMQVGQVVGFAMLQVSVANRPAWSETGGHRIRHGTAILLLQSRLARGEVCSLTGLALCCLRDHGLEQQAPSGGCSSGATS